MERKELLDLYSDYLVASFGSTTATGLSQLMDGEVSHDQVTRFLSGTKKTAADLWCHVKPLVRQIQSDGAVLIIDDSIEEKPYLPRGHPTRTRLSVGTTTMPRINRSKGSTS